MAGMSATCERPWCLVSALLLAASPGTCFDLAHGAAGLCVWAVVVPLCLSTPQPQRSYLDDKFTDLIYEVLLGCWKALPKAGVISAKSESP